MARRIHELLVKLSNYFMAETVLINAIESEFIDLIGIQHYSTEGSEISSGQKLLLMERWAAYLPEK